MQDFHSRVEGAVSGDDLAQLLYKVFRSGHEQEDEQGAARAAQSAMCKLEIKVCMMIQLPTTQKRKRHKVHILYDSMCKHTYI